MSGEGPVETGGRRREGTARRAERFADPKAGRVPGWFALGLALLVLAWAADDERAPLALAGAAASLIRAVLDARRGAVLAEDALTLRPEGIRIPYAAIGGIVRGVSVLRPARSVPGPVMVDAAAASFGVDRLRVRNLVRLVDPTGRTLLQIGDDRIARLDAFVQAIARRTGLPVRDGDGPLLPYPAEAGRGEPPDHLPALLRDRDGSDAIRRAQARDLLARAGRFDLLGTEDETAPAP